MQERVYHSRKLDTIDHWSRRSCWSDAHCHGAPLIAASDYGNVVCSFVDQNGWLITGFSNCLYCKIIVVTDIVLKYFLKYSTTFFANYQPGSDVLIHVMPYSVLRFHYDKIRIVALVALCSLYVPKVTKFYRCIQFYKQKWKLAPFKLAHVCDTYTGT